MTDELKELRQHVRWLEDEVSHGTAVDKCLDEIDGRLDGIDGRLNEIDDKIETLVKSYISLVDAINQKTDALKKIFDLLVPKSPPPPNPASDILDELLKAPNGRKKPAAKPKPRKPKLSVVPKDGDRSPGGAS